MISSSARSFSRGAYRERLLDHSGIHRVRVGQIHDARLGGHPRRNVRDFALEGRHRGTCPFILDVDCVFPFDYDRDGSGSAAEASFLVAFLAMALANIGSACRQASPSIGAQ